MLIDHMEVLSEGDELIARAQSAFDEFLPAVYTNDGVTIESNDISWVIAPNVVTANYLHSVFQVLREGQPEEVGDWLLALYAFNNSVSSKRKSRAGIDLLSGGTDIPYPIASAGQFGLRGAKVVTQLLLFLAKHRVVQLPFHFTYNSGSKTYAEFCGKSLPLHIRIARAVLQLSPNDNEAQGFFDDFDLPVSAAEVRKLLTKDDITRIPSYVTKAFIALGMLDVAEIDVKRVQALHQWNVSTNKLSHLNSFRGYSKILALALERVGEREIARNIRVLATELSTPVPESYYEEFKEQYCRKVVRERSPLTLEGISIESIKIHGNSYRYYRDNAKHLDINDKYFGVIETVTKLSAHPTQLLKSEQLFGHSICETERIWLTLQNEFLKRGNFESSKGWLTSFGYLNSYVFAYLRKWFEINTEVPFSFPSTPNDFRAGFFVWPIKMHADDLFPSSLPDFVSAHKIKPIVAQTVLRNLANFFEWIESVASHLPGCDSFKAPIASMDLPKASRPNRTTKGRFPKKLFPALMNYLYAIHAWMMCEHEAVTSVGGVKQDHSSLADMDNIDWSGDVTFVPLVLIEVDGVEKLFPIRYLPNVFNYKRSFPYVRDESGGYPAKTILMPHALVQILAAFETGQRHQNLQWLDRRTYSMFFADDLEDGYDVVRLFVNTDKVREEPFYIFTHKRVVEVFALQETFLANVDPSWLCSTPYEGRSYSKWGTIESLFQFGANGKPHSDSTYTRLWDWLLLSFQWFLRDIGMEFRDNWSALLPAGPAFGDEIEFIHLNDNRVVKIYDINDPDEGPKTAAPFVFVNPKGKFSPHTTRSTVVSNALGVLPAEFVGSNITGQTPATVCYYGVVDQDDLDEITKSYHGGLEKYGTHPSTGIDLVSPRPDLESSELRKAMVKDSVNALADFGCVSVTAALEKQEECGLEIAKVKGDIKGFDFTRERICPLNGSCPEEIISSVGVRNCAECYYAIFSVDHLPGINARIRGYMDELQDLKEKLADKAFRRATAASSLDELTEAKLDLARKIAGWEAISMMLEANRVALMKNDTYLVGKPELVRQKIERIDGENIVAKGMLLRLQEAIENPLHTSSRFKAKMRKLTRKLLVKINKVQEYEYLLDQDDPSREVWSLLKTIAKSYSLSEDQVIQSIINDRKPILLSTGLSDLSQLTSPNEGAVVALVCQGESSDE